MLTLLMTRPRAASERFVAELAPAERARLQVVYSPLLEIAFRPGPVDLAGLEGVIFTSANGVAAARAARVPPALPAYCVGAVTAEGACEAGWDVRAVEESADALIAALTARRPPAPLLHLRGGHARGDIAGRLTAAGIETHERVLYEQRLAAPSSAARAALAGLNPVIAPLFSPRTARQFADTCAGTAPLYLAAISAAAAEPVENMGARALIVAERPDAAAMAAAVETLAARASRVEGPRDAQ